MSRANADSIEPALGPRIDPKDARKAKRLRAELEKFSVHKEAAERIKATKIDYRSRLEQYCRDEDLAEPKVTVAEIPGYHPKYRATVDAGGITCTSDISFHDSEATNNAYKAACGRLLGAAGLRPQTTEVANKKIVIKFANDGSFMEQFLKMQNAATAKEPGPSMQGTDGAASEKSQEDEDSCANQIDKDERVQKEKSEEADDTTDNASSDTVKNVENVTSDKDELLSELRSNPDILKSAKVVELRSKCEKLGLSASGKKAELFKRIMNAL